MCGFAGIIKAENDRVSDSEIESMLSTIAYRGPDESGILTEKNIGLGSVRLSIVGLANGRMPIANEKRDRWIVYNGEIYNYQKHKKDLISLGHHFHTTSDTEVILQLYERYGTDCFKMLNGMFAVCIWDQQKDILILARDQMGQKPLFYAENEKGFYFASEIKAILKQDPSFREVSHLGVTNYLTLGYLSGSTTMYEGIHRLEPGHYLVYDLKKKTLKKNQFWTLDLAPDYSMSYEDAKKVVRDHFIRSVESRMMSEVPVSIFLSGGIDSSLVGAVISKILGHKLHSFAFGFSEEAGGTAERFNADLSYAQLAAERFGFDHHEYKINLDSRLPDILRSIVWHQDEPNYVPSLVPLYLMSQVIGKSFKVSLTGDGGDELFGGYKMYEIENNYAWSNKLPSSLRSLASWGSRYSFLPENIKNQFYRMSAKDSLEKYLFWREIFKPRDIEGLFPKASPSDFLELHSSLLRSTLNRKNQSNYASDLAYDDIRLWVSEHQTTCSDRTSMAASLEVRSPFLDHELVQLSQRIPFEYKLQNGLKSLLKDTFSDILPEEIRNRKKSGILSPSSGWIRNQLYGMFDRLFSREAIERAGLLNFEKTRKLFEDHVSKKRYAMIQVWTLASLQLWHEIHIQQRRHDTGVYLDAKL